MTPYVQQGQTLTYDDLHREAVAAFDRAGVSQAELARRLQRNRSTIHRALSEAGPGYAATQQAVIELLTEHQLERVEPEVVFRVLR